MSDDINYSLIQELAVRAHPLLNIADDFEAQVRENPPSWTAEVFQEARTAHHLLDMVGIPHGVGYAQGLDARTWLVVAEVHRLRRRLDRISAWHHRETFEAGMVGDLCNECDEPWPCETRRTTDGERDDA